MTFGIRLAEGQLRTASRFGTMTPPMKIFICHFPGHYIGGHAVILAPSEETARKLLEVELSQHGLDRDGCVGRKKADSADYTIELIDQDLSKQRIVDFHSGNY